MAISLEDFLRQPSTNIPLRATIEVTADAKPPAYAACASARADAAPFESGIGKC